jgi:hypothetical protein
VSPANRGRLAAIVPFAWPALLVGGLGWIFRPLLFDQGYGDRDLVTHYYPLARLRAATLHRGDFFPGWNPLLNGGMPYAADPLNGAFYPPMWLLGLLPDVATGFAALVFLHRALLALFTYRLARTLGLSRPAATGAGAVLAIGGTTLSTDALQFLYAYTWIPLYLDTLARFARVQGGREARGMRARHLALAATALTMTLLAGEPQTFYLLVLVTPIWLFGVAPRPIALAALGRIVGATAISAAAALALGAAAVLPLSELSAAAHRGVINDYAAATVWSFHPWRLIELFLVRPFGVPEPGAWTFWALPLVRSPFSGFYAKSHYLGAIFFALALAWPWLLDRGARRLAIVLTAVAAVALWLAMGDYAGLYAIPYRVLPRFHLFRFPERLLVHTAWPLALLAGLTIDGLARASRARALRLGLAVLVAAGVLVVAAATLPVTRIAQAAVPDQAATAAAVIRVTLGAALRRSAVVLAIFGAILAVVAARGAGSRPGALAALGPITVLLALGDLVSAEGGLLRFLPNAVLRAEPQLLAVLDQDWRSLPATQPDRQRPPRLYVRLQEFDRSLGGAVPAAHWQLAAHNVPLGFGMGTLTGYNSLELRSVVDFAQALPLERVAAVLGVDYLATTPADTAAARFTAIYRRAQPPIVAYRLPETRPPVALVHQVTFAPTRERVLARTAAPDFDPLRETALLGDRPALAGAGAGAEITPVAYAPDRVSVRVRTPDSAAVVLSEIGYPGWTAQVDQEPPRPTLAADGVVQAALVGPGEHTVVFAFRSSAVRFGAIVSVIAWAALIALLSWGRRAGRAGSTGARAGRASTRPPSTGSRARS